VEIRCYTNLPSAELFCNGRSFGTKEYNDELGYIDWLLPYEPGELTVTGIHQSEDNKEICDTLSTVGRSCNIVLHRWKPSEEVLEIPEEDALIQIEATITDDQNRWISNDSSLLRVTVTGAGLLAGIENGDLADNTEYTAFYRRAYEGRLIIYVTHTQPGMKLMVTVEGEGLKPAEYTI